ncbi:GNAT family N-acetyltransferase [Aggregatibacter kilianii]|uniref:GNAT family N-acetyltransferase n=1 Tax=Aggregatibacter kilianii TaxID=2025884 RepID=UPI000D64F63A|nr:GNAT family N-acetyltransferase [Aggregatibacter kilianii]
MLNESFLTKEKLILRRPNLMDKIAILEMIKEFQLYKSEMDGCFIDEKLDYENWLETNLKSEQGIDLPEDFVSAVQFVSFDEKGRAIGFLHLRLSLNEYLRQFGGHIGYSIRPSIRNKGYAKEQLRLGLQQAKEMSIFDVLLTCHTTNIASQKVILANGGIYQDTLNEIQRYWVKNK